ncbi:MAG: hypothetical protein LM580_08410 [Thermofilum sp.]|nr:hypothetical protein [Thermofilum sp.]
MKDDLTGEILNALNKVLSEQRGSGALITLNKLVRAGLRYRMPTAVSPLLEQLLREGVPDPLGRGVWRLRYVRRNGNRKRYYLSLRRGTGDG